MVDTALHGARPQLVDDETPQTAGTQRMLEPAGERQVAQVVPA